MFNEIQDWRAKRLGKFTGSEISKLLGTGKKKDSVFTDAGLTYIYKKVAEIVTGQCEEEVDSYATLHGKAHEYEGLQELSRRLNLEIECFGGSEPRFFPYNAYSGCSPDGLTADAGAEMKCPYNSAIHVQNLLGARSDKPQEWLALNRPDYYAQVQFSMMCCARDRWYWASYDPRVVNWKHSLAVVEVAADPMIQDKIAERLELAAGVVRDALGILNPVSYALASAGPAGSVIV